MFEWIQANLLWLWIQWTYGPRLASVTAGIVAAGQF